MKQPRRNKVELLAPAGNFEKLKIAIHYGADAVYLAGKAFSLRNFANNFTMDEMACAVKYANDHGVKVYVAVNIFARNDHIDAIEGFLKQLKEINPHGIIVADPGVMMMARSILPKIPLHVSTQANTTNYQTVNFLKSFGAQRVNMARELSLKEIKTISRSTGVETEAFVHGAMCISYSGRCLLSNFMADRPGNQGMCCHPCRFKYALVEELRKEESYPVGEDEYGTYFFNSKDLCMMDHLPEMIETGITSLKIEGRMKGIHYVATAVNAYRKAIDAYYDNPSSYKMPVIYKNELQKISHRGYCTGFYMDEPLKTVCFDEKISSGEVKIAGKVLEDTRDDHVLIEVRNKIETGDTIEILSASGDPEKDRIQKIIDGKEMPSDVAQPGSRVRLKLALSLKENDLIRKIIPIGEITPSVRA